MATSWGSKEKVFTHIDEILDIVLDNNDESGNDFDIGGSYIDNNWSDSEFEYEYEPLHQRKLQQAEIQHLEWPPQHVKSPLLTTLNVSLVDTENNDNEAVILTVLTKGEIQVDNRHFLMAIVPLCQNKK